MGLRQTGLHGCPKASTKARWSHPSSAFASCSSASTLSLWAFCRAQAVVAQHTLAFFMASAAWASFRCTMSALQWKSLVALFVSNCSRATFIFFCSLSSSSNRLAGPPMEGAFGHVTKGMLAVCNIWQGQLRSDLGRAEGASWSGCLWRWLQEGCHWDRGNGVHPLWPEGIFWFSGCWQWLFPWSALLGGRGWVNVGSLL